MATDQPVERAMWEAPREGFSARCCEYFQANFDNAPTFVVRSEFIKPARPGKAHTLRKHVIPTQKEAMEASLARGRKHSRVKHIGTRLSAKAMQASGSLVGN